MTRDSGLKIIDRAIFGALGLVLLALAAMVVISVLGWRGIGSLEILLEGLYSRPIESFIGAGLLLVGGLYLLSFASQKEEDTTIRQATEIGHVQISMRAIETLVYRTAKDVRGIKDVEARVVPSPEGVAIALSIVVQPDQPVPSVCEEVGHLVRNQVRESMGIDVGDVSIEVRNISPPAKSKGDRPERG